MIKKLKNHSSQELTGQLKKVDPYGLFEYLPIIDQPPTNEELMDKINEIIEHINKLENKKCKKGGKQ